MKKELWKKIIAYCVSIAMCLSLVNIPQTVHADVLEASDTLEADGGIWHITEAGEAGIYYVKNVKEGTYLASSGGFALSEEPYPIQASLQSDGGYRLDFQTEENPQEAKRYLSVGSNNYFSMGEQHFKNMFFFEKSTEGGQVSYTKTSELLDGKDYVLAMEHKSQPGTLYALLSKTNGSTGNAARAFSEALTVQATADETWAELIEAGVLWTFEKSADETGWYLHNVKSGMYLSDDGEESKPNIDLNDTPVAYTAELLEDGTFHFSNGTDKPHLAVGSGNKYSIGEQNYKSAALFEKIRVKEGFVLRKADNIQEGKEYAFAMAFRTDSATTAEGALLYALTDQKEGNGSSARILSHPLKIKDGEVLVSSSESDAAVFGTPTITVTAPEFNKAPKQAQASVLDAWEDEYTVTTDWSPQAEVFALEQPYTVTVTVRAQGIHSFAKDSLPGQITLAGSGKAELPAGGAVLSEDKKTITVSYTFDAITDPRQTPEYEVPVLKTVNLGTKLGEIVLPAGFAFEEDLQTVLDTEGSFTYHLTYTPEDLETWKEVNHIPVTVTVGDTRQTPDITIPELAAVKRGTKLGEISLPAGFAFDGAADTALDVNGTFRYSLTYTPEDIDTYKPVTAEVTVTVKDGVASFEAEGVLWKFEKAGDENGWYLKNTASGLYLSDSGEDYNLQNETPRIALNETPVKYAATKNTDGTFCLRGESDGKPYLAVGSGNRISIGESEQKTVLFEKQRDGSGFAYRKAQKITDGGEYIVAMAHRDNDASAGSASSLFAMTNQMYNNNRLLTHAVSVVDLEIDLISGAEDTERLKAPVIHMEEPKAGNVKKPAAVQVPYTLEGEYTASTAWSPAGDTFLAGNAYTAVIAITAQGAHYFGDGSLPQSVRLDGGEDIVLTDSNCKLSGDRKTITVSLSFAELSQAARIVVADGIGHGTVTVSDTSVSVGREVTVTTAADTGYELKTLQVTAQGAEIFCTDAGGGQWKFMMPNEDVTIYAEFVKIIYEVHAFKPENGVYDGLPEHAAFEDTVEFGIVPKEGFRVKALQITNQKTGQAIMPAEAGGRYSFVMPAAPVSVEVKLERGKYTVNASPASFGKIEISQNTAKSGVNIFVDVTPDTGYELKELAIQAADGRMIPPIRIEDTFYIFTMPGADVTVTPVFARKKAGGSGQDQIPPGTQAEKLGAPALISVKSKKTGVAIAWEGVSGAVGYEVYRTVSGKQVKVGSTASTSYVDQTAVSGKQNSYTIVAAASDPVKNSAPGEAKSVTLPANVKNLKVKASKGALTVSFQKVKGAKKYLVYRAEKKAGIYQLEKTLRANQTKYKDTKVKKGKHYSYKIVVMKGNAYSIPVKTAGKKAK